MHEIIITDALHRFREIGFVARSRASSRKRYSVRTITGQMLVFALCYPQLNKPKIRGRVDTSNIMSSIYYIHMHIHTIRRAQELMLGNHTRRPDHSNHLIDLIIFDTLINLIIPIILILVMTNNII